MNNSKVYFLLNILVIAFLSFSVYKSYSHNAPVTDYMIFVIILLTTFSLITDDIIALITGKNTPKITAIFNFILYFSVIILSIYALTQSNEILDFIIYGLFIPGGVMLMKLQMMIYRKETKKR